MFQHIRRHQKWLWIVISGLVIISFVWYFNPNQQMQNQGGASGARAVVGSIYGEPITQAQYRDAYREAMLQYLFSYNSWPDSDEFTRQMRPVERETKNRLLLIRKLDDYNIEVDKAAVADWISNNFSDPTTKQFNYTAVERFEQFIAQKGLKPADFERYVRHQVGIQHLAALAGAAGKLVTPQDAERALRLEREKIDTKVVLFPLSNYLAKVTVTPELIEKYYTESSARYRLPRRVQLSYVAFPASNYLAQANEKIAAQTNLNQQIDALYTQRGPQFYVDAAGQPLTPEAAKQRILDEVRKEGALMEARKAAYDFASGLEDAKIDPANPNPAEPLETLAAGKGLNVQVTQPFSEFSGPSDLNVPEQFTRMAFMLTPEQPLVQEPIPGEDSVYVVAFKRALPSELEPLDAVRERVTKDYTRAEAFKLMREAASQFITTATNALATGGQVEAVAQQSGVAVVDLPPMLRESRESMTNLPPLVDAGALRSAAMDLKPGELGAFVPTAEGGFVVQMEKSIPTSDEEVKQDLPNFLEEYRRRQSVQAFNDWFQKEAQLAKVMINGEKDEQSMAQ
jgi:hypothetical protein